MRINRKMSLGHLAELMGGVATTDDAHQMRALLCEHYGDVGDTADLDEATWLGLCDKSAYLADPDNALAGAN